MLQMSFSPQSLHCGDEKPPGDFLYRVFCCHSEYSCVETVSASQFNCIIGHISEKLQDCGLRIKGRVKWPDCRLQRTFSLSSLYLCCFSCHLKSDLCCNNICYKMKSVESFPSQRYTLFLLFTNHFFSGQHWEWAWPHVFTLFPLYKSGEVQTVQSWCFPQQACWLIKVALAPFGQVQTSPEHEEYYCLHSTVSVL